MIREWISTWRVRALPAARTLGLVREHAAIDARFGRVGAAWASHLEASKQAMLAGAARCRKHRAALIVGAGSCLDVPVSELAGQFDRVLLADVVISPAARDWARRFPGRVECVTWDATGALHRLAQRRKVLRAGEAEELFRQGTPGLPGSSVEPDLVVSANCLSQLGLIPSDALAGASGDDDETFGDRCARAAAEAHLRWLAGRSGVQVLLADVARLNIAADGRVLVREELLNGLPLGAPDLSWHWNLAPIPEWNRSYHRVHEVGEWTTVTYARSG